jgi:hypothetical protein
MEGAQQATGTSCIILASLPYLPPVLPLCDVHCGLNLCCAPHTGEEGAPATLGSPLTPSPPPEPPKHTWDPSARPASGLLRSADSQKRRDEAPGGGVGGGVGGAYNTFRCLLVLARFSADAKDDMTSAVLAVQLLHTSSHPSAEVTFLPAPTRWRGGPWGAQACPVDC